MWFTNKIIITGHNNISDFKWTQIIYEIVPQRTKKGIPISTKIYLPSDE